MVVLNVLAVFLNTYSCNYFDWNVVDNEKASLIQRSDLHDGKLSFLSYIVDSESWFQVVGFPRIREFISSSFEWTKRALPVKLIALPVKLIKVKSKRALPVRLIVFLYISLFWKPFLKPWPLPVVRLVFLSLPAFDTWKLFLNSVGPLEGCDSTDSGVPLPHKEVHDF